MDPQKFWPRLPFLSRPGSFIMTEFFSLYHRSLLQHAIVFHNLFLVLLLGFRRDRVSLVVIVFFFSAYSFYRDRVSSVTTDLSLSP